MPTGFPDYYGGLTLPVTVPEGGTGYTNITANALLLGNATSTLALTNVGTANQVLQIPGGGGAPQFQSLVISGSAISGIIPIANGGTGTATPGLVAGTGISITGTWPNNTIVNTSNYATLADPLPVAHGGTGTATPGLVAGTGISIAGSWPNNTIANTSNYATLADPLPVAHGGTGTATPGLVSNGFATITGTWPNQTIQAAQNFFIDQVNTVSLCIYSDNPGQMEIEAFNTSTPATKYDIRMVPYGGHLLLGTPLGVAQGGTGTATPALVAGTGISITGTWPNNTIANTSNYATLAVPLPVAKGGTGATSFAAAGIPAVIITVSKVAQTAGISSTAIFSPGSNADYFVGAFVHVHSPTLTSSVTVSFSWTSDGAVFTQASVINVSATGVDGGQGATILIRADSGQPVSYSTSFSNGGGADDYDLEIAVMEVA